MDLSPTPSTYFPRSPPRAENRRFHWRADARVKNSPEGDRESGLAISVIVVIRSIFTAPAQSVFSSRRSFPSRVRKLEDRFNNRVG